MSTTTTQESLSLQVDEVTYAKTTMDHPKEGTREEIDAKLAAMGYKAELPRSLSFFAVLGLSFATIAVPFGESTTLSIGLTDGGPVTIFYRWILDTIISKCIAASLAEI